MVQAFRCRRCWREDPLKDRIGRAFMLRLLFSSTVVLRRRFSLNAICACIVETRFLAKCPVACPAQEHTTEWRRPAGGRAHSFSQREQIRQALLRE